MKKRYVIYDQSYDDYVDFKAIVEEGDFDAYVAKAQKGLIKKVKEDLKSTSIKKVTEGPENFVTESIDNRGHFGVKSKALFVDGKTHEIVHGLQYALVGGWKR